LKPLEHYLLWMESNSLSKEEKEQLQLISDDYKEIEDRFYKSLEFGTGGLRGLIGLGTNRINKFVVRKATQGISNVLNRFGKDRELSAVIAYDTRNYSKDFASEAAMVLAANGIKAYLFSKVTPTPILSFAVRKLNADIGIVITASHNPKEYNGYKVYNFDGGQITLELAEIIGKEIESLDVFKDVDVLNQINSDFNRNIIYIDSNIYDAYKHEIYNHGFLKTDKKSLNVVYTPIHGSGYHPVKEILTNKGYQLSIVEEQATFDGNFPTVKYPNPEDSSALFLAVNLAKEINADIVLGTDPDADRVGVAVKHKNELHYLTGNEIGVLLLNHIIENKEKVNKNDYVVKTIVTSDLGAKIALLHGASVIETLTGFKFIGEKIKELELQGKTFLFGYEESYGYLKDTYVRDKDAVMSAALICDMAEIYKRKNMTLIDALDLIYKKYGFYINSLDTFTFKGVDGMDKMNNIITHLKCNFNTFEIINGVSRLKYIEDYSNGARVNLNTRLKTIINLPKSNVLKLIYDDESWFVIRPSGTEPKLKVYYQAVANSRDLANSFLDSLKIEIQKIIDIYT